MHSYECIPVLTDSRAGHDRPCGMCVQESTLGLVPYLRTRTSVHGSLTMFYGDLVVILCLIRSLMSYLRCPGSSCGCVLGEVGHLIYSIYSDVIPL